MHTCVSVCAYVCECVCVHEVVSYGSVVHISVCMCVPTFSTDNEGNWDFDLVTSGNLTASHTSIDHDRYKLRVISLLAALTILLYK